MTEENKTEGQDKIQDMKDAAQEVGQNKSTSPDNERAELLAKAEAVKAEKVAALTAAMDEKYGIQNIVEIIQFGEAVSKAIKEAKADGKIDLKDIGLLFPVAPLVVPMIDGIAMVPKELGDLDEAEIAVLMAEVAKALGADNNAKLVLQIKAGLKFAHAGYEFYKTFEK